jgi:hypothetical protein
MLDTMPGHIRSFLSILIVLLVLTGCASSVTPATPTASMPAPTAQPTITEPANSTQVSLAYLGQPAPGVYPIRFASKFIKGDLHTSPVFSPDGLEVYWGLQGAQIFTMRLENGSWTQPKSIAFSASMTDYRDPFLSPSGDKLFFLSKGKLPDSQLPVKENIWFVERTATGWSEPQPLNEEVNSLELHWQVSAAANGNIYFTSPPFDGDIHVSRYVNDRYGKAEKLAGPVNSDQMETTPYIAPDESYLIFARLKDQNSTPLLYISYAGNNGVWGEPVLIKRVSYGLSPVVSPDGKYLFFLSSPQSISWMSAGFIEELKP